MRKFKKVKMKLQKLKLGYIMVRSGAQSYIKELNHLYWYTEKKPWIQYKREWNIIRIGGWCQVQKMTQLLIKYTKKTWRD